MICCQNGWKPTIELIGTEFFEIIDLYPTKNKSLWDMTPEESRLYVAIDTTDRRYNHWKDYLSKKGK